MREKDMGTAAGRRRSKRLLSPSQKYEIWLQLVRQETTIAEAAAAQQVDRSTIVRIKQVELSQVFRTSLVVFSGQAAAAAAWWSARACAGVR